MFLLVVDKPEARGFSQCERGSGSRGARHFELRMGGPTENQLIMHVGLCMHLGGPSWRLQRFRESAVREVGEQHDTGEGVWKSGCFADT